MRGHLIALAFVAALAAGCASSSDAVPEKTTTTALAPLTQAQLDAALPRPTDLPIGWSTSGGAGAPFDPKSGLGEGQCGGPNLDARAQAYEVVGKAATGRLNIDQQSGVGQPSSAGWFVLYAFPSTDAAQKFMAASSYTSLSCPEGITYDEVDVPISATINGTWHVTESVSLGSAKVAGADEAFSTMIVFDRKSTINGDEVELVATKSNVYARFGDVVLFTAINAVSGSTGFSDSDAQEYLTPKTEWVMAAADAVVPHITSVLAARSVGAEPAPN